MWSPAVVGAALCCLLAGVANAARHLVFRGGFDPVFAGPGIDRSLLLLPSNGAQFSGNNGVSFVQFQQGPTVQFQRKPSIINGPRSQQRPPSLPSGQIRHRQGGFSGRRRPQTSNIVARSSSLSPPRLVATSSSGQLLTSCVTSHGLRGTCVPSSSGLCPGLNSLDSVLRQGLTVCRRDGVEVYFCCPHVKTTATRQRSFAAPQQRPRPAPVPIQPSEVLTEFVTTITQDVTLTKFVTEFVTERPVVVVTEVVTRTLPDVTVTRQLKPTRIVKLPVKTVAPPPPPPRVRPTTSVPKRVPATPPAARQTPRPSPSTTPRPRPTTPRPQPSTTPVSRSPSTACGGSGTAWMALIGTSQRWTCSGALVGPRLVLTAARCVAGRDVQRIVVRLGERDLGSRAEGRTVDARVREVIVHPAASGGRHDLALLRITTSSDISPVCMMSSTDDADSLTSLRTLGWGISPLSAIPAQSSQLATTPVRQVGRFDCDAAYRIFPTYSREFPGGVGETEVCVAAEGESTPDRLCPQDRGSPLVGTDSRGLATLVGVMREAAGCSSNVLPALYTHLKPYMGWIRQQEAKLT